MRGKDPDPSFARHTKVTKRVVALTVDYEDGERETLEFLPGTWATYRVTGNETCDERDFIIHLYDQHEIRWNETHWKKEE